ncbi:hypothetical protein J4470_01425 [Candidatus Woesearchaeota archaeon]|nr:hypothetical protein [Candidatus Woesearchaeota archaeon]
MPLKPKSVTTAADHLYELVKQEKEIAFKDASQRLKVPVKTIEAWATFLEEDGLLSVKYKLTTPYITLPAPRKKKEEPKETQAMFQEKLEELEVKSEIENASELLDSAAEVRSKGEFGILNASSEDLLKKLRKISEFLTSRTELSPQKKTGITDEVNSIERQVENASRLLRSNKFDEANAAYSDLHEKMQKVLEETRQEYKSVKEETGADEKSMQKLLESTYSFLEQGKLEDAEENYNKIKRMFSVFSRKFLSERSDMQDSILKLNRDLAVYSNKIKQQRMRDGNERINQLLKLTNQSIKKRQFSQATSYYISIKKIFELLPHGFLKEKRKLKEEILKVFAQIAREREERLRSMFDSMCKQIDGLLKDVRKQLDENKLKDALETHKTLAGIYSELPHGFMKEKFNLQNRLVAVYNILSFKLEAVTENEMAVETQKILVMLAGMERQTNQDDLDAADRTYSEINNLFKKLPAGFIRAKTELQEKIVEQYEKLLEKMDNKKTTVFKTSTEYLDKMISLAYTKLESGDHDSVNNLYKQIKAAYVKLQPTDVKQRETTRNKILALYRRILGASPMANTEKMQLPARASSAGELHKKIEELKLRSKAQVRLPA